MEAKNKSSKKSTDMDTTEKPKEEWLDSTPPQGSDPELDLRSEEKPREEWLHEKKKRKKEK